MKKSNLLFAVAGLVLASCSQQDLVNNVVTGDKATICFNVNMPGIVTTRDLGDGTAATSLKVLVFEVPADDSSDTTPTYVLTGNATVGTDGEADVSLDLVTGKSYQIVFFASSSTALTGTEPVYSISQGGVLTVNYDKMTGEGNMADAYDCFYGNYTTGVLSASFTQDVTLKRPVAQINWGTTPIAEGSSSNFNDIFGTNGEFMTASLVTGTVNAYNQLNLLTGEYIASTTAITIPAMAAPSGDNIEFPTIFADSQTTYDYVAMQYLLAPATSSILDLTLTISNAGNQDATLFTNDIIVTNAPIQANYKTNIYGALLSGNISFNVIKGDWNSNPNVVDMSTWDGETETYPTIPEDQETPVMINRPSDLAGLAKMVNGTASDGSAANDFSGYTIALAADFDMGGNPFEGIGSVTRSGSGTANGSKSFKGTFDGKGHTISNLTINLPEDGDASSAVGFIGNLDGTESALQNVTFDNLQINGGIAEQAGVVGLVTNGATVSNVTVTSGNVSAAESAGGIVGRVLLSGTIDKCSNGASVSSAKNCGGIVAAAYYTNENSSMTISGCENTGTIQGSYAAGGIVGLSCADVSDCKNSGTVTATGQSVGGVVGEQKSAGSVTGCVNSGAVTGSTTPGQYGTGGVVGWVRYQNDNSYKYQSIIVVNGNTNTASVSGATGVGGIVGMWYMCGVCYGNTNTAPYITSTGSFSAGIVGGSQWTEPTTISGNIVVPEGLTGASKDMLFVQSNYTTTKETSTGGNLSANYIYVNSAPNTSVFGNSMTNPDVVTTTFSATLDTANDPVN